MTNKEVKIPIMYRRKIESVIGKIDPNDESKFSHFHEIDESTKNQILDIYNEAGDLKAEKYLKYLLKNGVNRTHIFSFMYDVIVGDTPQELWIKETFG